MVTRYERGIARKNNDCHSLVPLGPLSLPIPLFYNTPVNMFPFGDVNVSLVLLGHPRKSINLQK